MAANMTPRERFLSALNRQPTDTVCVANPTSLATLDLMEQTGCFFPDVHLDADKMATLAAAGHGLLGYDTVAPYFSVINEAAALGCKVDWGDASHMPTVRGHLFHDPDEVGAPDDFLQRQPTRTILDAIRILRRRYGDSVAIVGKVFGGWTLAYHTVGIESFLVSILDEPDRVHRFLDRLSKITVAFAEAEIEAGADAITLGDHLTGDLCRPETYRDFLLPIHQELARRIPCPVLLHICGYTLDRLDYIAHSGFAAFHFDSKNNAKKAVEIAGDRIVLIGNVNNPETLLNGNEKRLVAEVNAAIEAGVPIVAPECAVPLNMESKWLKRIVEVARGR